jgi:hypothetical protein
VKVNPDNRMALAQITPQLASASGEQPNPKSERCSEQMDRGCEPVVGRERKPNAPASKASFHQLMQRRWWRPRQPPLHSPEVPVVSPPGPDFASDDAKRAQRQATHATSPPSASIRLKVDPDNRKALLVSPSPPSPSIRVKVNPENRMALAPSIRVKVNPENPNAPASKASFRTPSSFRQLMQFRSGQLYPRSRSKRPTCARPPVVPVVSQPRRKRVFVARDKPTQEDAGPGAQLVPEQEAFSSLVMHTAAAGSGSGGRRRTQTNWNSLVGLEIMTKAINEAEDRQRKAGAGPLSGPALRKVAKEHGVPESTFIRRMQTSDPHATPVVGRPQLTTPDARIAVAHATARADELQQGMSVSVILDTMEELHPLLTRTQLKNIWQHTIKHDPILTKRVTGDKTTDKRANAITELGQRQWFILVDEVRAELAKKSSGPGVDADGNTIMYGQVRNNFIVGGDEECVMLNSDTKKVIGKKGMKRHMVKTGDSRKSATAFRNGSVAGTKGPTIYILPGDTVGGAKRSEVMNKFVEKQGSPPGSFVLWNQTAYMTDDLWDDNVETLARGIRAMDPLISLNSNWWVEYHLDGFGSHVNTLAGQKTFAKYKIAVVQSQSHTSHVNQSFDDAPARNSKAGQREA